MAIEIIKLDYQNPDQGADLIRLMGLYAGDPMGGGRELSDHVRQNLVAALSTIPGAFSILAYDGDTAVGLINCFESFSTFACRPLINIHDVIVSSDHRGRGVVNLMLSKVEQIAIEKGCCKLTLEVLDGNRSAKLSYQKFGFSGYELDPVSGQAHFWEKKL